MNSNDEAKEMIIKAATGLIERSGGDIKNITARAIASESGASLGLINYHFGSKDKLIAICCDRMINKTLMSVAPSRTVFEDDCLTDRERLISFASETFEFVYKNYSTVKISILSDLKAYTAKCNSSLTQKGFMMALAGDMPEVRKKHICFSLVSIMQNALLAGDNAKEITGYSLKTRKQRSRFIEDTVNMLFGEVNDQ